MTFSRFLLTASKAISKGARTMKGCRRAIAIGIVGLLGAVPPASLLAAETPIGLDISDKIGPLSTGFYITQPVALPVTTPTGGSTVVFQSTLHLYVHDDTQTPPFNAYLDATGQAADPDTLVGGLLPAAIRVMQDLHAGMTFQQAVADAQAITEVTVTVFHDGLVEYALILALIAILVIVALKPVVPPTFGAQLTAIQTKMAASLAAIGFVAPPGLCSTLPSTTP